MMMNDGDGDDDGDGDGDGDDDDLLSKKKNDAVMWFADAISTIKFSTNLSPTFHQKEQRGCQTRHLFGGIQNMHPPNMYL